MNRRPPSLANQEMSIEQALRWAFQVEHASVDFEEDTRSEGYRPGISTIWVMIQRGDLGCKIDGGGSSDPHDDAQIIASFLARLPPERGGKGMAAHIASLARAGMQPDPMVGQKPRCVPREWRFTKWGRYARTEIVESITTIARGRRLTRHVVCCPVTYVPSRSQIDCARQDWLDYWGALVWLQHALVTGNALRVVQLNDRLPPMEPWR